VLPSLSPVQRHSTYLLRTTGLGLIAGLMAGSASALFLVALDWVTRERETFPWLLFLLPVAGALVGYLYDRWGGLAGKGHNQIISAMNGEAAPVPFRMAPFVLIGTLLTHLTGGSAGREGGALQIGGSLADTAARLLRLGAKERRLILMAGAAAGFGSIFGTPLAGTFFALEVATVGRIDLEALLVCLVGAYVGDWTTTAWGAHHTHYAVISPLPHLGAGLVWKLAVAALAFGVTGRYFASLTHAIKKQLQKRISQAWLRPVLGGLVVIGLTLLLGTREYLGLGIPTIVRAVAGQPVPPLAFLWKLLFTAVTVGSGFQGGEVTPLFFIGATLGHVLGAPLGLAGDYLAALGFVATFGAATKTPLACLLMGIELFGGALSGPLAIVCILAFLFSGRTSIYTTQRWGLDGSY
jgi:H+/Cl- antiporter ClcA